MALRPLLASVLFFVASGAARADAWCAHPLWVHEWGVHVLGDGPALPLPPWFHRSGGSLRTGAVRELPPDSGVRALPVLHFYAWQKPSEPIPIGLEVGFAHGPASVWFPQVDRLVDALVANGPVAAQARVALEVQRKMRLQHQRLDEPVPADPTRQLVWDRIDLTGDPQRAPADSDVPWVGKVRGLEHALWANGAGETDRFVFYEAATREQNPLRLVRANGWDPKHRAYVIKNDSDVAVHDVLLTHRDKKLYLVQVPTIAAHGSATIVLDDHHLAKDGDAETALRASLIAPAQATPGMDFRCVMGRDPAIPTERAADHRLYDGEIDALLEAWRARFFAAKGTTIVYREDIELLDREMPLSLYTDMRSYVLLNRASLALWEGVTLP